MTLSEDSILWALTHLRASGDSDLFPWACELDAFSASAGEVVSFLRQKHLSDINPGAARRFMVPKDEVSFRRATQLDPIDSLVLSTLIHEFGSGIERRRTPISERRVFSYRFAPDADGLLYDKSQDWTPFWKECIAKSYSAGAVLVLDISDFYNQIYHHTLENQLIDSGFPNQATKWILNLLKKLTAEVSRGVPVGPHAVHLLAEASLIPFDNALRSRGVEFARFVDDFLVIATASTESRKLLYQIADVLDKQQRLILNKSKTRILDPESFRSHALGMIEDRPINASEASLLQVIRKYSGGNPYATILLSAVADADLRMFSPSVIEGILSEYIAMQPTDFVRLRWFLRRLTQTGHPAAISFCVKHLDDLAPALADVCHYFLAVAISASTDIPSLAGELLTALRSDLIQSNEYFKLCVLSLFGRNALFNHYSELLELFDAGSTNIKREVILAGRFGPHLDWLRELKENFSSMDPWCRNAFLYTARSLPFDERVHIVRAQEPMSVTEEFLLK